ncbi:hypothetical protein KC353_g29 [Hortaea werneckii]|nr:hypothetical protein KC353_g29 [Hortaea werneckii]
MMMHCDRDAFRRIWVSLPLKFRIKGHVSVQVEPYLPGSVVGKARQCRMNSTNFAIRSLLHSNTVAHVSSDRTSEQVCTHSLAHLTIHPTDNAKNQRCRNLLLRFVLYSNAQESDSAWQSNEANGLSPKVCHNFSCNAEPDV